MSLTTLDSRPESIDKAEARADLDEVFAVALWDDGLRNASLDDLMEGTPDALREVLVPSLSCSKGLSDRGLASKVDLGGRPGRFGDRFEDFVLTKRRLGEVRLDPLRDCD
jgi:hypothetical protein